MNTFKSTERSLALLAFKRRIPGARVCQQIQSLSDTSKSRPNRRSTKNSSRLNFFAKPIIKFSNAPILLNNQQVRPLSSAPQDIPFCNPNKLTPDQENDIIVKPIVPLTAPRFPRNVNATAVPSVTKVLQATMSASNVFILERWKKAMIKQLGVAGFTKYQQETFERGRALHALLANYLLGHGEPTSGSAELSSEVVCKLWTSIQKVVREKISNVRLVEHVVTHPQMNYRGIVDCVAFYENELVVIDFKTAEKPKKDIESLYDNPLQVTAYCGAINNDSNIPSHVIDRNITAGLVVVAYVDGSEASTYLLGRDKVTNDYWKQWVTRLDQYVRLEESNFKTANTVNKG